jgi:septum formation protein
MLKNITDKYSIILASGSPRRQQFFKDLNIPFSIKLFDVKEIYDPKLTKEEITNYLSELKAKPFDTIIKDNELVITSDTIVWFKDKALGKPKDRQESFDMLNSLSDNSHEVITSISFKTKNSVKTIHDTTKVYFKKLSSEEINFYIDNFKPFDKAGSYGIQEWIGYIGVEKIEGNYSNVMGLPLHKLYDFIKNKLV